jgi:MFS family permease
MFFLHERARKINLWASIVIFSPYFGPFITAFVITTESWRWAFGLYTIMTGLCLASQIIFGEETFYDRALPQADRSVPRAGISGRMLRIVGIEQWRSRKQRNSFTQAASRSFRVLMKPTIFLSTV